MLRLPPGSFPQSAAMLQFARPIRDVTCARRCLQPSTQREESRDRVRARCRAMNTPSTRLMLPGQTSSEAFDTPRSDAEETLPPAMERLQGVRAEEAGESGSCSGGTADPVESDRPQ